MRLPRALSSLQLCGVLFGLASPALPPMRSAAVLDRAGDFIPTYTGVRGGDPNVLVADGTLNAAASSLIFATTLAGAAGATPVGAGGVL